MFLQNISVLMKLQRADHPVPGPRCSEGVLADYPNSPKFTLAPEDPSKQFMCF